MVQTKFEAGQILEATVKVIRDEGLIVDLAPGVSTLLHKKNLSHEYVRLCVCVCDGLHHVSVSVCVWRGDHLVSV